MAVDQSDNPENEKDKYKLDDQVGFNLRLAYQRHMAIFSEHMSGNLTAMQFSTLIRLTDTDGPVSQNALGRLVGMDAATTKGVISRLLARDLVHIERDAVDRRRYLLSTTEKGRELLAQVLPDVRQITEETLSPLGPSERRSLLKLLKKIN
ncbi:MAG: MarR family winged helix-turn-helix transcriptional regulator [Pseudoruegeria sp.]